MGNPWIRPRSLFQKNSSWNCVRMDPVKVSAKFAVRSSTRSWDNRAYRLQFWVGVANPQFWEGKAIGGRGWYRSRERWWVPIDYSSSIVTFHLSLSLRVSEILPFLCSSTPPFRTPPLVSPKFPHVPLEVGGWPLGHEERRCLVNCRAISFQDFQLMWSLSTIVTQKETDRQTELTDDMQSQFSIPRFALWQVDLLLNVISLNDLNIRLNGKFLELEPQLPCPLPIGLYKNMDLVLVH